MAVSELNSNLQVRQSPTTTERSRIDLAAAKARFDLVDYLERHGHLIKRSGATLLAQCPNRDHPDSNPSASVKAHQDGWGVRCWSCGWSGDEVAVIAEIEGLTAGEAIRRIAQETGLEPASSYQPHSHRPRPKPPEPAHPVEELPAAIEGPAGDAILDRFADDRGWRRATLDRLGATPHRDRHGQTRVFIPVRHDGRTYGGQSRLVGACPQGAVRWLTVAGSKALPFGLDHVDRLGEELLIVEGAGDYVTIVDRWPDAAVLGAPGTSSWQLRWDPILTGKTVTVVGDNDDAGHKFAHGLAERLEPIANAVPMSPPDGHGDVNDWARAAGDDFEVQFLAHYGEGLRLSLADHLDDLDEPHRWVTAPSVWAGGATFRLLSEQEQQG